MKVLLVEDEAALADVLTRNLRARGHVVRTQATAEDAMLSMMEDWPDALVLDVNLPDASGWEILRRLSQKDRDLLHVIIISAAPISQIRIAEFRPAHTLLKPFPLDALVRALSDSRSDALETERSELS
jgi:DNA-binding response OmpR family regulator